MLKPTMTLEQQEEEVKKSKIHEDCKNCHVKVVCRCMYEHYSIKYRIVTFIKKVLFRK